MPTKSAMRTNSCEGDRGQQPVVTRSASFPAPKLVAASELIGSGDNLTLPRLDNVPLDHSLCAGDEPAVALAKTLLTLDIAVPNDWEKAKHDPSVYIGLTLARWIARHGGEAIKRRFDLTTAITSCLDDYAEREPANSSLLYLTVDAGSAGYVVFSPAPELLEKSHPQLPATFFPMFARALNKIARPPPSGCCRSGCSSVSCTSAVDRTLNRRLTKRARPASKEIHSGNLCGTILFLQVGEFRFLVTGVVKNYIVYAVATEYKLAECGIARAWKGNPRCRALNQMSVHTLFVDELV